MELFFRNCCPLWKSHLWPSLHYECLSPPTQRKTLGVCCPRVISSLWPFRLVMTGCCFLCIVSIERRDVYTDWRGIRFWWRVGGGYFQDEPSPYFKTRRHTLENLTQSTPYRHNQADHMTDSIGQTPLTSKVLQILSHMLIFGSKGGGSSTD